MKLRMLAPVLLLTTGACFATRNDVRILQNDIQRARAEAEQRNLQLQQQQRGVLDSLTRGIRVLLDSVLAFQSQVTSTGGNLRTDQRTLVSTLERILAKLDLIEQRQDGQAKEISLLSEQMTGIRTSLATDSTRVLPSDGPVAKLLAARQQLERSSAGGARDLLLEVINETQDTLLLAEAHKHLADSYFMEQKRAEMDSVLKVTYERFPNALPFAAEAMYRHGVSLQGNRQLVEAKAILLRVVEKYPNSEYAPLAKAIADEIVIPPN